ncbi:protein arginine methyltransferase NDUFAF7, mitochondrial [Pundamilia nyererei]|uniref:Protein arginine methyltransferase NDUFAF7 n=1 Tax=Pundamilia nyererei TaxID=303518 RepID=A0A9Y6M920_9CICH|nr:PREDICTED: NADH dehydrogenase [ubiquinone] complex I, assembly factor 7 [Pundamilia nyererei]
MRALLCVKAQQLLSRGFIHPVRPAAAVRWQAAPSKLFCSSAPDGNNKPSSMLRHLTSKIKATGPIPVAEYMREVLTNPVKGYYVRSNMLGPEGDFITSPEISQIFGELIGVWIISEWMGAGQPKQLQLVELGPGKGSLASDVIRVFSQLQSVLGGASVSLHLVEVSPALSLLQAQNLTGNRSQEADAEDDLVYRRGETEAGLPVSWYRRLDDVPTGFSIFVAHEFFDALPIHKFQRTEKGWREVLVDIDPEKPDTLRFVVAPAPTLASTSLVQVSLDLHVSMFCSALVEGSSCRKQKGSCASGRGKPGSTGPSLLFLNSSSEGFKGHQLHDVLASPGSADLTADVDFNYLRRMAGGGVACLGPVTQNTFLKNMGIDTRMQILLRNCRDPSTRKQLISSYNMLTNPAKMGERFHFFSLLHPSRLAKPQKPQGLKLEKKKSPAPLPVAGFTELKFA